MLKQPDWSATSAGGSGWAGQGRAKMAGLTPSDLVAALSASPNAERPGTARPCV